MVNRKGFWYASLLAAVIPGDRDHSLDSVRKGDKGFALAPGALVPPFPWATYHVIRHGGIRHGRDFKLVRRHVIGQKIRLKSVMQLGITLPDTPEVRLINEVFMGKHPDLWELIEPFLIRNEFKAAITTLILERSLRRVHYD